LLDVAVIYQSFNCTTKRASGVSRDGTRNRIGYLDNAIVVVVVVVNVVVRTAARELALLYINQ
jgi:hypothetical protein